MLQIVGRDAIRRLAKQQILLHEQVGVGAFLDLLSRRSVSHQVNGKWLHLSLD